MTCKCMWAFAKYWARVDFTKPKSCHPCGIAMQLHL